MSRGGQPGIPLRLTFGSLVICGSLKVAKVDIVDVEIGSLRGNLPGFGTGTRKLENGKALAPAPETLSAIHETESEKRHNRQWHTDI